jgi:hypothetical protein
LVTGKLRGVGQTREIANAWYWGFFGVGIPKDFSMLAIELTTAEYPLNGKAPLGFIGLNGLDQI